MHAPYNPYGPIHKIQRHLFGETLTAIGALDVEDDMRVGEIAARIGKLVGMIHEHTDHEDDFIHPLLDEAAPDVREALDAQHAAIDESFIRVQAGLDMLMRAPAAVRAAPAVELYRDFALLTSTYFAHMDAEERRAAPALLSLGIERVQAAQAQIVRRVGWQRMRAMLPASLPILAPPERIGFVGMLAATFPEETSLAEILELAAAVLPAHQAARLSGAFCERRSAQPQSAVA